MGELPVVDLSGDQAGVAAALDRACREVGFFYVVGHGVDPSLATALREAAAAFFALPAEQKAEVAMSRGGRAWRGWFPVGAELTAGVPDAKEGYYFGAEEPVSTRPLAGPNLWPTAVAALRPAVLAWMGAMEALGHRLVSLLGVPHELVAQPTVLFRVFRYPPGRGGQWGVAEHSDYGLLTILLQDEVGGLEVRLPSSGRWVPAPPVPGSFVCNVGDVLERLSGGRWRSTHHRVRNTGDVDRWSFPFFFDPSWDAPIPEVEPAPGAAAVSPPRWDGQDLYAVRGSYGDYLLQKVSKVFPALADHVL